MNWKRTVGTLVLIFSAFVVGVFAAAENSEKAVAGIRELVDTAQITARAAKRIQGMVEFDGAVGQNWNQLAADFPALVDTDTTILIGGQRQTYTAQNLNQAEKALKEIGDAINGNTVASESLPAGTQVVQITGTPLTRILEILESSP